MCFGLIIEAGMTLPVEAPGPPVPRCSQADLARIADVDQPALRVEGLGEVALALERRRHPPGLHALRALHDRRFHRVEEEQLAPLPCRAAAAEVGAPGVEPVLRAGTGLDPLEPLRRARKNSVLLNARGGSSSSRCRRYVEVPPRVDDLQLRAADWPYSARYELLSRRTSAIASRLTICACMPLLPTRWRRRRRR
jgi:hypothetical protein